MGINQSDISFLSALPGFDEVRSVCDLGDQDLLPKGRASDYWKSLGMRHLSLDLVGDATHFDLNTDSVPESWGRFDLVTNCGTTEHVFNQANAFRVIHDLTKVGGIMYHQLPVAGDPTHGLFVYTLKFFKRLAKANAYEILCSQVDVTDTLMDPRKIMDPSPLDTWITKFPSIDGGIRVAFLKKTSAPFSFALDTQPSFMERAGLKLKSYVS